MSEPTVTVLVPTYRRPMQLRRCLEALALQSRAPDQLVVVRREDDGESGLVIREAPGDVLEVTVNESGVLAAMTAGARQATSDILALTDDDVVPRSDWLERLLAYFDDPSVGGVGGRDVVHTPQDAVRPLTSEVGRITSWGKLIGNHHLGFGPARDVMILKGANMAFRRDAFALPRDLRGAGAQVHWEVATSLWARKQGWRLIYDPQVVVDHYPGPRFDPDRRGRPQQTAIADAGYNLLACLATIEPRLGWRRAVFGVLVGERANAGLARAAFAAKQGEWDVVATLLPSLRGQIEALVDRIRRKRIELVRFADGGGPLSRRRPKVALVAHDVHDHGGMERSCAELIRRGRGTVDFVVVSASLSPELRPLVDWRRVRIPRRPFPLKFAGFFIGAGATLRKLDADIRHTMGAIVPNRTDVASIQFCHAAYRVATHGTQRAPTRPLRRLNTGFSRTLALLAERWCYKVSRVRTLAAASSGIARELAQHYPGVPVAVTPNGVDASRFHPDPSEREEVRAANRIAETDIIVLFVGGDWYRKGLEIAITAVAETTRLTSAPLFLWVVGRGDRRRFGELARTRGIGDRVRFFGQRPDTERFFKAADVFVFPTLYEAFPLVALEASASGLPIIAARTNGIEELVEGNAGLIVDRTPRAFAAALARLASDAELRKRMGAASLERSREFTWDDSVGSVLRVYEQLVGRP